jgi:competence protein ComGC
MKRALLLLLALSAFELGAADPPDGQALIGQAYEAQGRANHQALTNAIAQFRQLADRYPTSLEELVTKGILAEIPAAPPGQKFAYDPKTGRVTLTGTPAPVQLPEPTQKNVMAMALDAQAKANLKNVRTALNVYVMEHDGQYPAKLEELVKIGMLEKLPTPPAGTKYSYDPKTGKVDYVKTK